MNHITPAINDKIKAITDTINEMSNTGKDFTVLTMDFVSSINLTSFIYGYIYI
jgi:hypothetical protein